MPIRKPKSTRERSDAIVKDLATRLGMHPVKNSGAGWAKTDVKGAIYAMEHKYTDKDSYSIKLDTLAKLCYESGCEGREPLFGLTFTQATRIPADWIMMPADKFKELNERVELAEKELNERLENEAT